MLQKDLGCTVVSSVSSSSLPLVGEGGIGKTHLAKEITQDPEVKSWYCDNIIWVQLSQEPNLVLAQRAAFIAATGHDPDPEFKDERDGKLKLKLALSGKAVLLVVDDAWTAAAVEAFQCVDKQGFLLVTSRMHKLMEYLDPLIVPRLTESEANTMLAKYSGDEVESVQNDKDAQEIIKFCARLPLALGV